jgi:hypothetical protein
MIVFAASHVINQERRTQHTRDFDDIMELRMQIGVVLAAQLLLGSHTKAHTFMTSVALLTYCRKLLPPKFSRARIQMRKRAKLLLMSANQRIPFF